MQVQLIYDKDQNARYCNVNFPQPSDSKHICSYVFDSGADTDSLYIHTELWSLSTGL